MEKIYEEYSNLLNTVENHSKYDSCQLFILMQLYNLFYILDFWYNSASSYVCRFFRANSIFFFAYEVTKILFVFLFRPFREYNFRARRQFCYLERFSKSGSIRKLQQAPSRNWKATCGRFYKKRRTIFFWNS